MKRPGKLHTMVTCASCMILYASHNCEVVFADMVDVIKKITCLWNHISLAHIVNIIWQISSHRYHLTNHIVNIIWQIRLSISSDKSYCQYHLTNHIVNTIWQHIVNIIWQISSHRYHLANLLTLKSYLHTWSISSGVAGKTYLGDSNSGSASL